MANDRMLGRLKKMLGGLRGEVTEIGIETQDFGGVPILAVEGDIDHHTAGQLRGAVEHLLAAGESRILLDLERVTYMDSGGMSLLFDIARSVRETGWVGIVRPGPNVRRLLEITGLYEQEGFRIFASAEEARAAIRGR